MQTLTIPRAWETLWGQAGFVPIIEKNLERVHDTKYTMEPNLHDSFEMVYIKKGDAEFLVNATPVPVSPNDIIIIKPYQYHKFRVKSETGCDFIVLNFKFENRAGGQYSEVSLHDFLHFVSSGESGDYISLKVSQKNEIISLLERILRERSGGEDEGVFLSQLLMMELFVHLSRALKQEWEDSIRGKSPKRRELIDISVKYIQNHFERNLSLGDMAKYVFLSPGYFTHAFKEETGVSPIQYLLKVRVERACELLADTDDKIIDIALAVGFSHPQRFNESFKKYAGVSPTEFRRQNRRNHSAGA